MSTSTIQIIHWLKSTKHRMWAQNIIQKKIKKTTTTMKQVVLTQIALATLFFLICAHNLHEVSCQNRISPPPAPPTMMQNNDSTATTTQPIDDESPSAQNLSESLSRFLHALTQRTLQQQQQQQFRQQFANSNNQTALDRRYKSSSLNKISCDELSLVVLAQRVLNVNSSSTALSRLIECKHERLLDSNNDNNKLRRRDDGDSISIGSTTQLENQKLTTSPVRELHFGAKIALTFVFAIVCLVTLATLVDYQYDEIVTKRLSLMKNAKSCKTKSNGLGRDVSNLRDYRSLSMSSNCSSNLLFCSTSSVASSSVPILRHNQQQQQHNETTTLPRDFSLVDAAHLESLEQQQQQQQSHHLISHLYEQNLKLHCNEPQALPLGESHHHKQSDMVDDDNLSNKTHSSAAAASSTSFELKRQILLAFSLRQSARQIFGHHQKHTSEAGGGGKRQTTTTKLTHSMNRKQQRLNNHQLPHSNESIDSLHGLRFLSMIWVIIIHSYNFALRWMFFSSANSLDEIYRSTASQLIANGSFACDSFFFAGGFLLPYLAFKDKSENNDSDDDEEEEEEVEEEEEDVQKDDDHDDNEQQVAPSTMACCKTNKSNCTTSQHQFSRSNRSDNQQQVVVAPQEHATNTNELMFNACSCCCTSCSAPKQKQQQQQRCATKREQQQRQVATARHHTSSFTIKRLFGNILHRYVRMMPLMMAIIGLCSNLLRYLGDGPAWHESTMMYDEWCRSNWWINAAFMHNFVNRQNMCLSHSWYSAVDIQLFLIGQLILFVLAKHKRLGLFLLSACIIFSQLLTLVLTLTHHLPAVPLVSSVSEQTMNLYYGQIYIKPYCRASPYMIGLALAYLMRTTSLGVYRLKQYQALIGWILSLSSFIIIIFAMQPAMNGHELSAWQAALYSALSRPMWACATGWMIYACITKQGGGFIQALLSARCFIPFSRLTYPAFLIHPIVMALFYGSRSTSFQFSHYLMLYLILGNIVITYACAFVLAALFELPLISIERILSKHIMTKSISKTTTSSSKKKSQINQNKENKTVCCQDVNKTKTTTTTTIRADKQTRDAC